MKRKEDANIDAFARDITANLGYLYTTHSRLSSQLANQRYTDATLTLADFYGKRVIDIGCGDGTYSIELYDRGRPASMHCIDSVHAAIEVTRQKIADRNITSNVQSIYELPYEKNSFDIAHLRGVLHHVDRPVDALQEAFRVASTLIILEPNGYNLGLKLIERFSNYHIEHKEKSYAPMSLNRWINTLGGTVIKRKWVGLVPMFCPDWFARTMKLIEPAIEQVPAINALMCAVNIFVATRSKK